MVNSRKMNERPRLSDRLERKEDFRSLVLLSDLEKMEDIARFFLTRSEPAVPLEKFKERLQATKSQGKPK